MVLNIVIIGASNAGHGIASELSTKVPSSHRILLIDPASVSFWPVASLRAAVVPGWESKVYHKLDQKTVFPADSRHLLVRNKVVQVQSNEVVLDGEFEGSDRVPFDVLVFATGASQPFPMRAETEWSPESVEQHFGTMQKEISDATNIVISGGGPTGVEFAGELIEYFGLASDQSQEEKPRKKITLVQKGSQLIDSLAYAKLATTLQNKLVAAHVDVLLNDTLALDADFAYGKQAEGTVVKTSSGKELVTDFVFCAIGNRPNTSLVSEAVPSMVDSNSRLIKVNNYLQVDDDTGYFTHSGRVFAAGDCANGAGWRSLVSLQAEVATVSANVLTLIKSPETASLRKHKPGLRLMFVPLGTKDGVSHSNQS